MTKYGWNELVKGRFFSTSGVMAQELMVIGGLMRIAFRSTVKNNN